MRAMISRWAIAQRCSWALGHHLMPVLGPGYDVDSNIAFPGMSLVLLECVQGCASALRGLKAPDVPSRGFSMSHESRP